MDRLACVDLPAFPLQLLLREHPDWHGFPTAVVAEEKPQAFILWVNEKARRLGIRPGHRYAAGLALSLELRAGAVGDARIQDAVEELTDRLRRFTPEVEPADERWRSPGLFWLNASGLERLYPTLRDWGGAIRSDLESEGLVASVVVGFTRFGTYAVARTLRDLRVFDEPAEEERAARRVPLARLDLPPGAREIFSKLRVRTVSDFLRLPPKGLRKRFGPEVEALHRLAAGDLHAPLAPKAPEAPLARTAELPWRESDRERLLFYVKRLLDDLLRELDAKSLALAKLHLELELDDRGSLRETLRPDAATLSSPLLLGLVRLRLETLRLDAGVVELGVRAEAVRRTVEQLSLVAEKPPRDPKTQGRAFARLRAELGDEAVVRAELSNGHLPQARFRWTPLERLPERPAAPTGTEAHARLMIRRIYERPLALPPRSRHEPDGWLLRGLEHGPARDFLGPYILSGGWWRRTIHREYYFVKMQHGDVFWVFYDRCRRRWFLEGRLE